jgi:hypothetical protein
MNASIVLIIFFAGIFFYTTWPEIKEWIEKWLFYGCENNAGNTKRH